MKSLLLRRLAVLLPTLLLVSMMVFGLQKLLPGDPALALAGEERNPEVVEYLRQKYRFNDPIPVQYAVWLKALVHGDFGTSVRTRLPIGTMLAEKLPVTAELAMLSMLVALLVGLPIGIFAALGRGTPFDYGASLFGLAGLSIPHFWLGIMLILLFSVNLGWLPAGGFVPPSESVGGNLLSMLMPALVLGTGTAAIMMRHVRGAMIEAMKQDYVRTARAKGVRESTIVLRHALPNALIPVVTLGTLQFGELLAGAVLTEQVFSIRQDGRRRRFQPRLCRGSGGRALHSSRIPPDEPDCRRGLCAAQSEAQVMSSIETVPVASQARAAAPSEIRRLLREPSAVIGATIILFFVVLAVFASWIAPYDPNSPDWMAIRAAPGAAHWFGTDDLGRDVLSRVIFGTQASLAAGIVSVTVAVLIGLPFGLMAGYFGGLTDMVISRFADALLACPFLVLAIALAAFLGPSLQNAMIAIGISAVPVFVRVARAETLVVCTEDYIAAARSQGLGHLAILTGQVLPNVLAPTIVQATLTMAIAVLAEASLAFLGLGQLPPAPSWGAMLDVARQFLGEAPWMAFWPGLAIIALVIGFNLMGDGLNDALNPRH
ncbi:ABC-type dipeptide/oligopeptide/nickel transport system permease subunit [Bradyrhizobium barranii subsp. barranii]